MDPRFKKMAIDVLMHDDYSALDDEKLIDEFLQYCVDQYVLHPSEKPIMMSGHRERREENLYYLFTELLDREAEDWLPSNYNCIPDIPKIVYITYWPINNTLIIVTEDFKVFKFSAERWQLDRDFEYGNFGY